MCKRTIICDWKLLCYSSSLNCVFYRATKKCKPSMFRYQAHVLNCSVSSVLSFHPNVLSFKMLLVTWLPLSSHWIIGHVTWPVMVTCIDQFQLSTLGSWAPSSPSPENELSTVYTPLCVRNMYQGHGQVITSPVFSVGCNYLSLPFLPASGTQIHSYTSYIQSKAVKHGT